MHLTAAVELVNNLIEPQESSSCCTTPFVVIDEPKEPLHMYQKYTQAIPFMLSIYLWFDTISAASRGCRPLFNHHLLISSGQIHPENAMGCETWALLLISEVSELQSWKEDLKKRHELDVVQLISKGASIERQLRERLDRVCDGELTPSSNLTSSSTSKITKIFALSALTFLHVVILGAFPKLKQIMASVSRTIVALQSLGDHRLLRVLGWSICITGCMALDEQQAGILDLVSRLDDDWNRPNLIGKILEECWSRRASGEVCEWTCVMRERGFPALI